MTHRYLTDTTADEVRFAGAQVRSTWQSSLTGAFRKGRQTFLKPVTVAAVILAATAIGSSANATTYLVTFTGTVTSSADPLGIFGPPGTDLVGKTIAVSLKYDPQAPGAIQSDSPNGLVEYGGFAYSANNGIFDMSFDLNGQIFGFSPDYQNTIETLSPGQLGLTSTYFDFFGQQGSNPGATGLTRDMSDNTFTSPDAPFSLNTPFSTSSFGDDAGYDNGGDIDVKTPQGSETRVDYTFSGVEFAAVVSGAPEPSIWAELLAGLFGLGLMVRRGGALRAQRLNA